MGFFSVFLSSFFFFFSNAILKSVIFEVFYLGERREDKFSETSMRFSSNYGRGYLRSRPSSVASKSVLKKKIKYFFQNNQII